MRRLIAIGIAGVVLALLVIAQLVLPGIAGRQLRDRLAKNGKVLSVSVSAFPALELLWHDADRVVVRMASYRSGTAHLSSLLDETSSVGTLEVSVSELQSGLLTVHGARLSKHGDQLTASATVREADLRAAVPFIDNVTPVASGGGQLTLRGTATLLGVTATVDATVAAQNGNLVVVPDVPFGGLATVTLFSDPHVRIESVTAAPSSGGFSVSAQAQLN